MEVGIADLKVSTKDTVLKTTSLGSCIALILYDPLKKIGGLAHIMHSDSNIIKNNTNPAKCVDTAISEMLRKISNMGGEKIRLKAYIIGGACMFTTLESGPEGTIGKKNINMAKEILEEEKISIEGEDTGLNYGRSVEFSTISGEVVVKSMQYGVKKL